MSFNFQEYFDELNGGNVMLSYKGCISTDLINRVLDSIETKLQEADESSKIRKKVYNVLVEGLQNLYHYNDDVPNSYKGKFEDGFGVLVIKKLKNFYNIEPISLEGTPKTPTVNFNADDGVIEIKGRSIPESSIEFYKPLVDWLEKYKENAKPMTKVIIQLEYFNTSSSKCILDVFKKLEAIHKAKNPVVRFIGIMRRMMKICLRLEKTQNS